MGSRWARGLRSVERMPGGALLYRVFFGSRERPAAQRLSFDDIDRAEANGQPLRIWLVIIGVHLLLILLPVVALLPPPEADTAPEKGMMVDLISEPDREGGTGRHEVAPLSAASAVEAQEGRAAGLPVLASPVAPSDHGVAVGDTPLAAEAATTALDAPRAPVPREAPAAIGSVAAGPGTMSPDEARWEGDILARIGGRKRYPARALEAGVEDKVLLRLVIDRAGKFVHAEIARSAGHKLLDAEVLALARRAAPYPRPPASVVGPTVTLIVPVDFVVTKKK
ncbi:energy transducer TonB [Sphingopyxis sp. YR583]|uniref:energy transducer TonB n=1 Tax=Sphingopyxis sp. YR583 TaxID=1881047 RepID=UPI00115FCB6D|nr:TonB family protein [Sphingopyxis sp. YR583]